MKRTKRKDPALALVGMLETIKRLSGTGIGMSKQAFPGFTGYVRTLDLIYHEAKRMQADVGRFVRHDQHYKQKETQ